VIRDATYALSSFIEGFTMGLIIWKRTLRTASSERFLAIRDGAEIAATDLHYLPNGVVSGTMTVLEDAAPQGGWSEEAVAELLRSLDDDYLPDVDVDTGNLVYTVVVGRVIGNFEATKGA
jgi:hypothetical protein